MADSRPVPYDPWHARFADYLPTAGLNPYHLGYTFRLVILRESSSLPMRFPFVLVTQNNPRVADMSYVNFALADESDAGGGTSGAGKT